MGHAELLTESALPHTHAHAASVRAARRRRQQARLAVGHMTGRVAQFARAAAHSVAAAGGRHLAARGALRVGDGAHVRDGRPCAARRCSDHVLFGHDGLDALVAGVLKRLPDQVLQRPAARRLEAARHRQGLLTKLHPCTLSRHCSVLTPCVVAQNSHAVRVDKQKDLHLRSSVGAAVHTVTQPHPGAPRRGAAHANMGAGDTTAHCGGVPPATTQVALNAPESTAATLSGCGAAPAWAMLMVTRGAAAVRTEVPARGAHESHAHRPAAPMVRRQGAPRRRTALCMHGPQEAPLRRLRCAPACRKSVTAEAPYALTASHQGWPLNAS